MTESDKTQFFLIAFQYSIEAAVDQHGHTFIGDALNHAGIADAAYRLGKAVIDRVELGDEPE